MIPKNLKLGGRSPHTTLYNSLSLNKIFTLPKGALIRIFGADPRSQEAVSADTITDTDLFEAFFLSCIIIYRDAFFRRFSKSI